MENTSITALVIGGLHAGFAAGTLIDALTIFGLGFSASTRLRRRDSSVVLLGLPGAASPGVIAPGLLGLLTVATHRATARVPDAVRPYARRTYQQGQYDYHNSHDDLLFSTVTKRMSYAVVRVQGDTVQIVVQTGSILTARPVLGVRGG
jgi:hypothetical protein